MKLIIGVLILLIALFYFSYHIIESGQRDAYTVLYFYEPTQQIFYDNETKLIAFNFTIANNEYKQVRYEYRAGVLALDGNDLAYKEGYIELPHGENATITESLSPSKNPVGGKLYVQLYTNNSSEPYRAIWQRIK